MVVAMFSWAIYSALLKKKKHEISQIALLQTIISMGLIFLFPIYIVEMKMGYYVNINIPFLLTLPLQLLAYHVASLKNCDIDKPRNLAKSVTVE